MTSEDPRPTPPSSPEGSEVPPEGEAKPLPGAIAFAGMGMTIAGCVGAGVVLGLAADSHFHTSPAFLVVGLVLGVAAAVGAVTAQVKRFL